LCACSPVATPTPYGFNAFRIAAWPTTSSGAVGSSMKLMPWGASFFMYSIACGTSQTSVRALETTQTRCTLIGIFGSAFSIPPHPDATLPSCWRAQDVRPEEQGKKLNLRFESTIMTQPVGPAFLPSRDLGLTGGRLVGILAGSSMIDLMSLTRRTSSSTSAPTLSCWE
jgi:hypothetical protein